MRRSVWIGTVILVALVLLRHSHAAHTNGEAQTLTLEAGTYTIAAVDNLTDGANGLPSIHGTLTIRSATPPIAVEREVTPSHTLEGVLLIN